MMNLRWGALAGAMGLLPALPAVADGPAEAATAAVQKRAQERVRIQSLTAAMLTGKSPGEAVQMMCDEVLPTQKGGYSILSRTAPAQNCATDCSSEVTIRLVGGNCEAEWKLSKYRVVKGKMPALRWTIEDKTGGGVKSRYRFDGTQGIGLCPQSKNDPAQDLKDGRCVDADCQTFEWTAVNRRAREREDGKPPYDGSITPGGRSAIHFGIAVVDTQNGNQVCNAVDPVIINRGP